MTNLKAGESNRFSIGVKRNMNDRSQAISILQRARDTLGNRLTERILEARQEIESDAEGGSYLSEIETIYEQLGSRLAHVNAMLSHLPPTNAPASADVAASEIIYADLASAYPSGLELEAAAPQTLLALPAPTGTNELSTSDAAADPFAAIVACAQAGDLTAAARMISELLDLKPSEARRCASALSGRLAEYPELARRICGLTVVMHEMNEYAAAAILGECFELRTIEALSLVRYLQLRNSSVGESR